MQPWKPMTPSVLSAFCILSVTFARPVSGFFHSHGLVVFRGDHESHASIQEVGRIDGVTPGKKVVPEDG